MTKCKIWINKSLFLKKQKSNPTESVNLTQLYLDDRNKHYGNEYSLLLEIYGRAFFGKNSQTLFM